MMVVNKSVWRLNETNSWAIDMYILPFSSLQLHVIKLLEYIHTYVLDTNFKVHTYFNDVI